MKVRVIEATLLTTPHNIIVAYYTQIVDLPLKLVSAKLSQSSEKTNYTVFALTMQVKLKHTLGRSGLSRSPIEEFFLCLKFVMLGSLKSFYKLDYHVGISCYLHRAMHSVTIGTLSF